MEVIFNGFDMPREVNLITSYSRFSRQQNYFFCGGKYYYRNCRSFLKFSNKMLLLICDHIAIHVIVIFCHNFDMTDDFIEHQFLKE